MQQLSPCSLADKNTFAINSESSLFYQVEALSDLQNIPTEHLQQAYILGEGSNTLFIDKYAPLVIQPQLKGVQVSETADAYQLSVAAGENWHQLVCYCIENNINGLENLALIPGAVGAAPVQNIGAYGVEFADYCQQVHWFDFASQTVKKLNKAECKFAYRDSIFKKALKGKGIIVGVELIFPKKWQPNLNYAGLDQLAELGENLTAQTVMEKVIEIREQKLPDPEKLANAGSFFKNPVVELAVFEKLSEQYPNMPAYPQGGNQVKLAAGWLIEQAGLKGYRSGEVGVHQNQALVLINYGVGTGQDIVELARYVQKQVFDKFAIKLSPEVRFVSELGETNPDDVLAKVEPCHV